jgi:hypothetical protein
MRMQSQAWRNLQNRQRLLHRNREQAGFLQARGVGAWIMRVE